MSYNLFQIPYIPYFHAELIAKSIYLLIKQRLKSWRVFCIALLKNTINLIGWQNMSDQQLLQQESQVSNGAILIGAGLAIASFIVLPAVAARLGIGSSLTGAMRIALMKASTKVCNNSQTSNHNPTKTCLPDADCHQ